MATAAGQAAIRAWCLGLPFLVAAVLLTFASLALAAKGNRLPEGTISEIKGEGNASVTFEQIRNELRSRVGRPLDRATVEQDMKALLAKKWFSEVVPVFDDRTAEGKAANRRVEIVIGT